MTKKSDVSRPKVTVKEEVEDDPAGLARSRLKGVLEEMNSHFSDTDYSGDSDDQKTKYDKKGEKDEKDGRKKKRSLVQNNMNNISHNPYVMKLFDRSVDLAQFNDETPLYPICRAWVANKPKFRKEMREKELDKKLKKDKKKGVDEPVEEEMPKLAPPAPINDDCTMKIEKRTEDKLVLEDDDPIGNRNILLMHHLAQWSNVKRKSLRAMRANWARFDESNKVLEKLYVPGN